MTVTYRPNANIVDGDADILVNTVNCVGVMGKGVALAFKNRFPAIMPPYQKVCRDRVLRPGGTVLFALPGHSGRHWAAMATKDHWRNPSQLPWIVSGLQDLAREARAVGARSIALPPPGCGQGGLDWRTVEPLVLDILGRFDLTIHATATLARRAG